MGARWVSLWEQPLAAVAAVRMEGCVPVRVTASRIFVIFALGTVAALASAVAQPVPDTQPLLASICDREQLRPGECLKARGYPEGKDCNIILGREGAAGRFLDPETMHLLAVYTSDCESHAENWGGSLIFKKIGEEFIFQSYQRGLVVHDCITMPKTVGGDRLICIEAGMAQGYASFTISELLFRPNGDDALGVETESLVEASNFEAALGVNTVNCDEGGPPTTYFRLDKLTPGPRPESIAFDIALADQAIIRKVCATPGRNGDLGDEPPASNKAYIALGEEKVERHLYDLRTRKLISIGEETPRGAR
jgi:hypothetical protein